MEQKLEKLKALGLDTDEGMRYTGGADKYITALTKYVTGCADNSLEVRTLYDSGDIELYTVKVHALKSNSRTIGNSALFRAFESLELAGKRGDSAFIKDHTAETLALYADFSEAAVSVVGGSQESNVPEISAEEAAETADEILTALDECDDELSAELMKKLSGYPFASDDRKKLGEAIKCIGEFMYDEAEDIIKELRERIV